MATFAQIIQRTERPTTAAMLLMMAWIAASDGRIADEELIALRTIAAGSDNEAALNDVINLSLSPRTDDLQDASEILLLLDGKQRRLVLQMALGIALQDGYFTTSEIHIVRFLADLLGHSPQDLDTLFREMTGDPFPTPGDQSSIEWWQVREGRSRSQQQDTSNQQRPRDASSSASSAAHDLRRLRDLAVLGLDEGATLDQIKAAYRRMAMVHHPDKFTSLGPEAIKAAELTFQRIRAAYERLVPA